MSLLSLKESIANELRSAVGYGVVGQAPDPNTRTLEEGRRMRQEEVDRLIRDVLTPAQARFLEGVLNNCQPPGRPNAKGDALTP